MMNETASLQRLRTLLLWIERPIKEVHVEVHGMTTSEDLFRFVALGVLQNGIGVVGLLGNALTVLVLSRPHMRSSINCLLVGLAACDMALILTSVLLFGLPAIYPYTGRMRYFYYKIWPHLAPYVYPLANATQTMSVYLTLMVTVERWVAVCHPLRAKALCTSSRACWCVLGTALFSLAYNAPRFFEMEVHSMNDADGVTYILRHNAAFRNETYILIYIHWMYLFVMYIVPFSALAALNLCIVRQVRRAQAKRAKLSHVQQRELGLATMLLIVVLVFFICNILPLVANALEVFMGDEFKNMGMLVHMSNLLVTINSSVNFIIYVIFGKKFKQVFVKMFCVGRVWWRKGRESPKNSCDSSDQSAASMTSTVYVVYPVPTIYTVYPTPGTELTNVADDLAPPDALRKEDACVHI